MYDVFSVKQDAILLFIIPLLLKPGRLKRKRDETSSSTGNYRASIVEIRSSLIYHIHVSITYMYPFLQLVTSNTIFFTCRIRIPFCQPLMNFRLNQFSCLLDRPYWSWNHSLFVLTKTDLNSPRHLKR